MDNKQGLLKNLLLRLLDRFVQVCDRYKLHYYLAYGTALGAVRHNGIIPWDDDIDVCLMRDDYEKLQLLPDEVWGNEFRLVSWKNDPKYRYHFLKLELLNTTVIEQFDPIYVGGVYLDVFPLDVVPLDKEKAYKQALSVQNCYRKYYLLNALFPKNCTSIFHLLIYQVRHFLYTYQHIQDKWEKEASRYQSEPSGKIVCFHSEEFGMPMNSEWFGEGRMLDFEGKRYRVPIDTDSYLKYLYGDYLTPPPIDKRDGHSFLYLNITERIAGTELIIVKKKVKRFVSYHFDINKEWKYIKWKLHLI